MRGLLIGIVLAMVSLPFQAQAQTGAPASTQSLVQLARKMRARHKAKSATSVRVFTNDNVPHQGGISVMGPADLESAGPGSSGREIPCQESDLAQETPETYYLLTHSTGAGQSVLRTRLERIKRSSSAKNAFKRECPCPATGKSSGACRGYVIDHILPLACGGADAPANMAWQTTADGKAKDKWERKGCGR